MQQVLTLPIKRKWFDMILAGEKQEEYRELKPYYDVRFENRKALECDAIPVKFQNGYSGNSPYFVASCSVRIGTGKSEWGATVGEKYYVLQIKEILVRSRCLAEGDSGL